MDLGFYNYTKSGKGVDKNGPQKKPFFKFWELFGRKFWNFFTLNLVYVVFCLPVVTFGPATAALTHVMRKYCLEDPIFPVSEFWKAFKKNFKQSVGIGIFDVAFAAAFFYSFYFLMGNLAKEMSMENIALTVLCIAITVYFTMINFYIYMQIIALNLKMKAIVKNAMLLTVLGIKRNIFTFLIFSVFILALYLFLPWSVLVMPVIPFAWLAFMIVFISYPVIQKHIINPYYESKGEINPELIPKGMTPEEAVFTDRGGSEAEIAGEKKGFFSKAQSGRSGEKVAYSKPKGKVIK